MARGPARPGGGLLRRPGTHGVGTAVGLRLATIGEPHADPYADASSHGDPDAHSYNGT